MTSFVYRAETRERNARYSKAQDAARRSAAEELRKSRSANVPWWERMGENLGFGNLGAMASSYVTVRSALRVSYNLHLGPNHCRCFV